MLRTAGWRITGALPPLDRFVVIVAPHTSNWDFLVGIATMFALGLQVSWLGKHSIFRGPFAPLLRWLGGVPVDRAASRGLVEQVAEEFRRHERFVLGLAPEGTRGPVAQWKTGFHAIARAAGVKIVPVWFDYSRREVGIGAALPTTDDVASDVRSLRANFRASMARVPGNFAE
jgi:1-acyl-sn-glycerol-3-phosphate acyltransferase